MDDTSQLECVRDSPHPRPIQRRAEGGHRTIFRAPFGGTWGCTVSLFALPGGAWHLVVPSLVHHFKEHGVPSYCLKCINSRSMASHCTAFGASYGAAWGPIVLYFVHEMVLHELYRHLHQLEACQVARGAGGCLGPHMKVLGRGVVRHLEVHGLFDSRMGVLGLVGLPSINL
jgi:hypothetical protein